MSLQRKLRIILIPTLLLLLAGLTAACAATNGAPSPSPSPSVPAATLPPEPSPTATATGVPSSTPLPGPTPTTTAVPIGIQNANDLRIVLETGAGSLGALAVSPDGRLIAAAGSRGLWLFDKFTFDTIAKVTTHAGAVLQIAWDPTGSRLASSGTDGTVRIWDLADPFTPLQLALLVGHTGSVHALAWSPDGSLIASGGEDGAIRIWNARTFKNTLTRTHTSAIYTLDWHPASELLLIGEFDGSISVTNGLTGENFASFAAHDGWVNAARWSPDGSAAVTGGLDRVLRIWNLEEDFNLQMRVALTTPFSVNAAAWTPDGSRIAAGGGTPFGIGFFTPTASSEGVYSGIADFTLEGHTGGIHGLAFAQGGVLLSSAQDNSMRAWDVANGRAIRWLYPDADNAFSQGLQAVDVSVDGLHAATGGPDGLLRTWDLNSGESRALAAAHSGQITSLDWSPGGNWIATGSSDNFTRLWDAETGDLLQEVRSEGGQINAVAFSPFGNLLASGGLFRIVQVWTAGTDLDPLLIFPDAEITALEWASSGSILAIGGSDGSVQIYNGQTGAATGFYAREHNTNIVAIRWEPLGGRIAALDRRGTIVVWDSGTGEVLARRAGDGRVWNGLSWAPQGVLATGNEDGEILVFEAANLTPLYRSTGHAASVNALVFTEIGNRLVSVDANGGLVAWEAVESVSSAPDFMLTAGDLPGAKPGQFWPAAAPLTIDNAVSTEQLAVLGRGTALTYAAHGDYVAVGGGTGTWIYQRSANDPFRYLEGGRTFGTAWSPDGHLLAARELQVVRIWDVETATLLRAVPAGLGVRNALAWSPDGLLLATADRQGDVSVFSLAGGEKLFGWPTGMEVRSLAWHSGGRWLAAAAGNDIYLWDTASGDQIAFLHGHDAAVQALSFHPDKALLLSSGEDLTLRFWDLNLISPPSDAPEGGEVIWPEVPSESIRIEAQGYAPRLTWSTTGETFFTQHESGVILEWGAAARQPQDSPSGTGLVLLEDGNTFRLRTAADGHFAGQLALAWLLPDGLLTLGENGSLQTMHIPDAVPLANFPALNALAGVQNLLPGSAFIIFRNDAISRYTQDGVWLSETDIPPGLAGLEGNAWVAAIAPDGSALAVFEPPAEPAAILILDLDTGERTLEITLDPDLQATAFSWSPDGARLAAGLSDGSVRTWNMVTGTAQVRAAAFGRRVNSLTWSPDGRWLAAAGSDGNENGGYQYIRLLDSANGGIAREFALDFARTPLVLAFSLDGRLLASGDSGGGVQIWDVNSGDRLSDLSGHKLSVTGIAFSPSGDVLATSSRDGTLRIWGIGE